MDINDVIHQREEDCLPEIYRRQLDKLLAEMMFQTRESGSRHNSYDQEIRELSAIENGDVQALEESILEEFEGELGTLDKTDALRNMKNLSIVVIALASRAAIKGGLSPELSFSMSDIYINALEECRSAAAVARIARGAEYRYARLVRELSDRRNDAGDSGKEENEHIARAKDYIYRNLHRKLGTTEIADALALNSRYLSTLFRQETGMTLSQYILREKIRLVKNMLTYSEYSYLDIANYLGFSSQSHLGEQFRRETGMTMKEYRTKYQKKGSFEFHTE